MHEFIHSRSSSPLSSTGAVGQRKCACGGTPGPTGECEACRTKRLQRKTENRGPETQNDSAIPPIVHEVLRSPGQPLDAETRAFMEPRFGHDFSGVRVHADGEAASSARAVFARAYAAGHHLVFDSGEYAPTTAKGKRLLAHELAHIVQQGNTDNERDEGGVHVGESEDSSEQEADRIAEGVVAGGPVSAAAIGPAARRKTIQRKNGGGKAPPTPSWTADELKKMLDTCDGGLGIWEKAKKANKDKDPKVSPGARGATDPNTGDITLDKTQDKCFAVQQLVQELSNLSRMGDFIKIFDSAKAGNLGRADFITQIEKIEYETGVKNVLTAFDACKDKWSCTSTPKEWARTAKDFDDYFKTLLSETHKEHYGTAWDKYYKAAYDKKHAKK